MTVAMQLNPESADESSGDKSSSTDWFCLVRSWYFPWILPNIPSGVAYYEFTSKNFQYGTNYPNLIHDHTLCRAFPYVKPKICFHLTTPSRASDCTSWYCCNILNTWRHHSLYRSVLTTWNCIWTSLRACRWRILTRLWSRIAANILIQYPTYDWASITLTGPAVVASRRMESRFPKITCKRWDWRRGRFVRYSYLSIMEGVALQIRLLTVCIRLR